MGKARTVKFEQAIEQLEQIIEGIESGDIGLEEGLAQYEKGMKLIRRCRAILTAAEKRIAELTADDQDGLRIGAVAEEADEGDASAAECPAEAYEPDNPT